MWLYFRHFWIDLGVQLLEIFNNLTRYCTNWKEKWKYVTAVIEQDHLLLFQFTA